LIASRRRAGDGVFPVWYREMSVIWLKASVEAL
jgi:hypothetical protein